MSTVLFNCYNEAHIDLANLVTPHVEKYCKAVGYTYEKVLIEDNHIQKHRYLLARELIQKYDTVIYLDTDIFPLRHEPLNGMGWSADFEILVDRANICTGAMIFRQSDFATWFLESCCRVVPRDQPAYRLQEEDNIVRLVLMHEECRGHTRFIPEHVIAGPWFQEDYIKPIFYHAWSTGYGYEFVHSLMKKLVDLPLPISCETLGPLVR